MIRFLSFGSGSSGNCYYLENDDNAIIIDAGVGIRKLKKWVKEYGINLSAVKGIIITHDHADHIKAAGYISIEQNIKVFATAAVHRGIRHNINAMKAIPAGNAIEIETDVPFSLAGFTITAFPIPHDSAENVGYSIQYGDRTFCIMTDIGAVTEDVRKHIGESDYIVIESNHDREMLLGGKYPRRLKERIMSGMGHLSNAQTAKALVENVSERTKHIWLCHLSEENNHPELARKTIECEFRAYGIIAGKDFELDILRRLIPTGPWILD